MTGVSPIDAFPSLYPVTRSMRTTGRPPNKSGAGMMGKRRDKRDASCGGPPRLSKGICLSNDEDAAVKSAELILQQLIDNDLPVEA